MSGRVSIIELKETILKDNDKDAEDLRETLKKQKTFYLNVMSSPGSGKTTTILNILKRLPEDIKVAVMEADIDSDVDAVKIEEAGVRSIQLHTAGMCHLDADMSRQGLRELPSEDYDFVILENVGNLVCPAEFDTGAAKNLVILSLTEGDDKPLKYPLMFEKSDVVLINKVDAAPVFDFDFERAKGDIHKRHPCVLVFPLSGKTGEGYEALMEWLVREIRQWNN
jgi:hydrogenase nickel incorporation protein HypB